MNVKRTERVPDFKRTERLPDFLAVLGIAGCMAFLMSGCFGYLIGPLVGGLMLGWYLPTIGIGLTWWQVAIGIFLLRLIVRIVTKK